MTQEIVLTMTDGTEFFAQVQVKDGNLEIGLGFDGMLKVIVEGESARNACHQLLRLLRRPGMCVVCGTEPVTPEDGEDTCRWCVKRI